MSALKPDAVDTHELGTSALPWKNLHIDAVTIGARSTGANVPTGSEVVIGSNAKLTADPSVPVDVEIYGSLTVHGQTTTISSTTLTISDKEIIVAQGAANSLAANGAGLRVNASGDTLGAADATLLYDDTGTQWEFNKNVETAGSLLPEGVGKASFNLGSTSQPWNDLFLSNGGVISFANTQDPIDGSDLTLTHSADLLTISGGNTRVDRLEIDSENDYIDVDTDLTLTASAGITLDAVADIVLDADGDDITFKAGTSDSIGLKWSQSNSGDWTNLVGAQDKDLIFQVNDGGVATEVMKLVGESSSLQIDEALKLEFRDAGIFAHSNADGQFTLSSDGNTADAINIVTSDVAGGIDIDAGTSGIAIGTTGAYTITAAGNSTISTTGTGTLTIDSGGALVIDTDGTDSISLGIEAAAKTITIGNDASTKVDVNALAIELDSAGSIVLDSATTTGIDSTGNLSINSDAEINIGNAVVAQPINVGTGASARTITIGNDASTKVDINALAIELDAGTSGFTIDGAAASSVSTSGGALTISGKTGLNLQEDGQNVIAIDTDRDVLFSQTGGATDNPDVEFDGYVRFDGSSEFDGAVQVDGTLTANAAVSVQNTLTVGEDDTGYDVKLFGATSGQFLLWDESADELVLAGDSKLSFHDAAGGENIIASANGHLEVNAGDTLDMTAPTVDINASTAVTVESATFTLGSVDVATDLNPTLTIQHTGNNANGGTLKFVKDKGAAGAQGDDAGVIQFFADNAAQNQKEFARITAEVQNATNEDEGGKLSLGVRTRNEAVTSGLVLTADEADGVINVTIGAGTASETTIAGDLIVNGTTTTVNSTTVQVDDKNIELGVGSADDATADGGGITLKSGDGDKTFNWVNATKSWTSSEDLDLANGKHLSISGTAVLTADGVTKVQSAVAGAGLSHSSGELAVGVDGSSIEIDSDALRVKASGITNAMLAGSIDNNKLSNSSVTVTAGDGLSGGGAVSLGGTINLAVGVDDSSIETDSDALRVKASGITNAMLAGSIANDKLLAISTANKVEASALELSANTAMEDDVGLCLKANIAGDGLAITEEAGNQVLSVRVDDSSIEINSDVLRVKASGITNAMLAGSIDNNKLSNSSITLGDGSNSTEISLGGTVVIQGTNQEIQVAESNGTFTIGLPDDVTINGDLTVDGIQGTGNISTTGNISSAGLTATSASIRFNDTLLQLGNSNSSNKDHGFYSERGSNSYVGFVFDETHDEFRCFTSTDDNFGSDDNTDGSTNYTLADLRIRSLAVEGKVTHAVTETTSGAYTIDTDQDDYIINATHQVTLLGAGVAAPAGRELLIVNTSGSAINVTTNDTANLYVGGTGTGLSSDHPLAANSSLKIVGVGGHWYAV
jgi:hypothetical protein